jgi:hypothetical protein
MIEHTFTITFIIIYRYRIISRSITRFNNFNVGLFLTFPKVLTSYLENPQSASHFNVHCINIELHFYIIYLYFSLTLFARIIYLLYYFKVIK